MIMIKKSSGFNGNQDYPKGPVCFQLQDGASQEFHWPETLRLVRFSYNSLVPLITASSMDRMKGERSCIRISCRGGQRERNIDLDK